MSKSISGSPKTPKTAKRKPENLGGDDRLGADVEDTFVPADEDSHFVDPRDDEEAPDEHGDDGEVDATDDPVRMEAIVVLLPEPVTPARSTIP